MSDVTRYPLSWPSGWRRTPAASRKRARFVHRERQTRSFGTGQTYDYTNNRRLTIAEAVGRLRDELRRLGVLLEQLVVSTDVPTRNDGLPYSRAGEPTDPGAAVYFVLNGRDRCLACDTWDRVADNLAAIAGHIDAIRRIDRYGVGTLDQAFAGYVGLPAKGETWRATLGFPPDATPTGPEIDRAFRDRARDAHPDRAGGSHDAMSALTAARLEGREELGLS